jgi:hypothetical protein
MEVYEMQTQTLHKIKEMLCKELDEYGKKEELTAGSLDIVDKLTHALKSVETIIAMNEASEEGYSGNYPNRYSGARGRYARRDSMGRYSGRGGSYGPYGGSYGRPYYGGGSYDDGMMMEEM